MINQILASLQDQTPVEKKNFLENNASKIEESYSYTRFIDEEEKLDLKNEIAELSIRLSRLNSEKKDFIDQHKLKEKPIKSDLKMSIEALRLGAEEVVGKVYQLKDFDAGKVYFVNTRGQLVDERFFKPGENQVDIHSSNLRTGTH